MKLVATKVFYSFTGYDRNNRQVSYGSGMITEQIDLSNSSKYVLEQAKENNKIDVVSVHIIAITPLEFETEK